MDAVPWTAILLRAIVKKIKSAIPKPRVGLEKIPPLKYPPASHQLKFDPCVQIQNIWKPKSPHNRLTKRSFLHKDQTDTSLCGFGSPVQEIFQQIEHGDIESPADRDMCPVVEAEGTRLLRLEKRRFWVDLTAMLYLQESYWEDWLRLFTTMHSGMKKENRHKLKTRWIWTYKGIFMGFFLA